MLTILPSELRRHPGVWAIAASTCLLHLVFAGRYDFFRNELYYVVCGRHPAFGYADQPPLVPLLAAATQLFGLKLWLLRVPAALAAAALVPLTAAFARLLGGGAGPGLISACAAALAPALIGMGSLLTTSTFEPLAWTGCAYLVTRAALHDDRRALLWAGVVAGIASEAKYGIGFWVIGLGAGLLLSPARAMLATRNFATAAAVAAVIAAPSLIWQSENGWPFFEVMVHHSAGNFTGTPLRFEIGQAVAMNALLAPLWLTGLIAPFAMQTLKPARFIAIAYVVAAALIIGGHGKDYYLFPAYPALFAVGAVACARLAVWVSTSWMLLAAAATAPLLPIVLPILQPAALAAYLDRMHLHPRPDEEAGVGAPLTQVFSDELGWRALEQSVAAAYRALPPDEQRRAAIVATN